ncbi:MAG: hypothetical protein CMJ78_17855 [Planctomycetaceae bacterium]|nr:hypothetical protein [Planctomycetaceae bacterium]
MTDLMKATQNRSKSRVRQRAMYLCFFTAIKRCAVALSVVMMIGGPLFAQQPTSDSVARSPKRQMTNLLKKLHESDATVVSKAREDLKSLGVSDDQIEFGRLLVSKKAQDRIELAGKLKEAERATQMELLFELSNDRDKAVRSASLESLKKLIPDTRVQERVAEMAKTDPDAVVRGHARLLSAEWKFSKPASSVVTADSVAPNKPSETGTKTTVAIDETPTSLPSRKNSRSKSRRLPTSAIPQAPRLVQDAKKPVPWATAKPVRIGAPEQVANHVKKKSAPQYQPLTLDDTPIGRNRTVMKRATPSVDVAKTKQTVAPIPQPQPEKFEGLGMSDAVVHSHHIESKGPGDFPTKDQIERVGLEVRLGPSSPVPAFDSIEAGPNPLLLDLPAPAEAKPIADKNAVQQVDTVEQEATIQPIVNTQFPPLPSKLTERLSEEMLAALQDSADPNRVIERPTLPVPLPGRDEISQEITAYNYDEKVGELLKYREYATFGFSGPKGQLATEVQTDSHFVPIEDRWRIGNPYWDRYGTGHPPTDDYPGVEGHWWDPYNQNVLKGDYPIIGQHTFLNFTGTSLTVFDYRETPIPTSPFESTLDPFQEEFFGDPAQFFFTQFFRARFDLFHANDAAFKPLDWQIRLTPVYNVNYLDVAELGIVRPDVRQGTNRQRDDKSLEEWFVEFKLADISPDYDFMSIRAGSQFFVSDFRGHIFFDTNRGIRLFGSKFSNRDQFNLVYFDQAEKNTNSGLNTDDDRHQEVVIANYYRQDFLFPGYTAQVSYHYNHDKASREFDRNDFVVRPDPAGVSRPHDVKTHYLGWAGNGHIYRWNIDHAMYYVFGEDSLNPIGGRELDISAMMAAVELSYDRDWARFRTSLFWASGDDDPTDTKGEGFDTIIDNPVFTGEFSYWSRQRIGLFGVGLVQDRSLVPSLRSSKLQGQANHTNPGVLIVNTGFDADITPKLKLITNMNYLWFDQTEVLEAFTFQGNIEREIGLDLSMGYEYRPFHNDNVIILIGASALAPGNGFKDLYNQLGRKVKTLYTSTLEVILTF